MHDLEISLFPQMGVYKGMTVAIKWVEKDSIFPARRDLMEMKAVRLLPPMFNTVYRGSPIDFVQMM